MSSRNGVRTIYVFNLENENTRTHEHKNAFKETHMFKILKNSLRKGLLTEEMLRGKCPPPQAAEAAGAELSSVIRRRFGRSFHIRQVDTGSCGACESEIQAASNPIYDMQRFGIDIVASPRHADALLVTGPVSRNMELALRRTYEAMPEPKLVITMGDCALNGGKFRDSYYTCRGVHGILPVALHIPGCPPSPEEIINCLLNYLEQPAIF